MIYSTTYSEAGEVIEWEGETLRDQDWVEHQSIRYQYESPPHEL